MEYKILNLNLKGKSMSPTKDTESFISVFQDFHPEVTSKFQDRGDSTRFKIKALPPKEICNQL